MTRKLVSASRALGATAMVWAVLGAHGAHAQVGTMLGNTLQSGDVNGGIRSPNNPDDIFRKQAPAPGLPGARATPDRAAPASKLATDMKPNDALFDAVNRGDIAAVRDALGRGADVNAHNELGLTPVDLSVDLGHTGITFLLLSMRGAAPARATAVKAGPAPARGGHVEVRRAPLAPIERGERAAQAATARPVASHPAPQPRPRVIADDGGTPRPQAGFLGFGR